MTSTAIKFASVHALLVLAVGTCSVSQAQQVYRIVGPDGKVSFSDQPPPSSSQAKVTSASGEASKGFATASLPFELRKATTQFPVTLFTGTNCGPCATAKSRLTTRGIPYTEKTVSTNEDLQALKRLSGESTLPLLTIGSQQLKGFSDAEWMQFLDAAGYPKTSILPATYRQAEATPLVTVAPAAPPVARGGATQPGGTPAPTTATPPPTADNPAGIRF